MWGAGGGGCVVSRRRRAVVTGRVGRSEGVRRMEREVQETGWKETQREEEERVLDQSPRSRPKYSIRRNC